MIQSKTSRRDNITLSHLSRVGWLSLMLSLASKATAFNASPREPFAMLGSRGSLRDTSTDSYGRQNLPRQPSTSTRLQYRDGNEDPTAIRPSFISSKWWNGLFASKSETVSEQDSVDDYLEFLDRRYNRLHEEKEEKPFSAINWLLQGSPADQDILTSKQQKEDALYVLGVAGLASEKLLQKHPHLSDHIETTEATPMPIEALDAIVMSTEDDTFGHMVVKKVLVPFAKFLYFVHRRKQVFLNVQAKRARQLATKAAKSTIRTIIYGPVTVGKVLLDVGGGKRTILSTFALCSTLFLLARPVIQAIIAEGSVSP